MSSNATATRRVPTDAIAFAVLALIGGALVVTSFGYGIFVQGTGMGPGFLPLVIGSLLSVLASIQFARSWRAAPRGIVGRPAPLPSGRDMADLVDKAQAEPSASTDEDIDIFGRTEKQRIRQLWTVIAATAVCLFLVPYVGFLPALGLLALFISVVVERRSVWSAAAVTVGSLVVLHLVFHTLLKVPLPEGLLLSRVLGG